MDTCIFLVMSFRIECDSSRSDSQQVHFGMHSCGSGVDGDIFFPWPCSWGVSREQGYREQGYIPTPLPTVG